MREKIKKIAKERESELIQIRRTLHQHPKLTLQKIKTKIRRDFPGI